MHGGVIGPSTHRTKVPNLLLWMKGEAFLFIRKDFLQEASILTAKSSTGNYHDYNISVKCWSPCLVSGSLSFFCLFCQHGATILNPQCEYMSCDQVRILSLLFLFFHVSSMYNKSNWGP